MMLERDLKRDRDEELGVSRQELGVTLDLIMHHAPCTMH
jgi:hypothetical protein